MTVGGHSHVSGIPETQCLAKDDIVILLDQCLGMFWILHSSISVLNAHQRVDSFVEGPMQKWARGPRPAPLPYHGPRWLPMSTYLEEALEAAVCHIVYLCREKC